MLKIIKALLTGKELDAENVLKLISHLPEERQEVAVEMALGIYEEPELPNFEKELVSLKEGRYSTAIPARIIKQEWCPMTHSMRLEIETPQYKSLECPFTPGTNDYVEFAKKVATFDSDQAYEFGKAYAGQHQRFRLKTFNRKTTSVGLLEFEKTVKINCIADMDENYMTYE